MPRNGGTNHRIRKKGEKRVAKKALFSSLYFIFAQEKNPVPNMAIHKIKIFAGRATRPLAEKIAASFGTTLGQSEILSFSDGEFQPTYNESIRGCTVFCIQSTFPPTDNLMELLMMIDAAKRASAYQVVAVMPYFGWARQDRKDRPRVPIGAKLVANMLKAAGAGAASQHAVGTAVFWGTVCSTILGIFFIPVFFVVVCATSDWLGKKLKSKPKY
jgi:hypothetical protein